MGLVPRQMKRNIQDHAQDRAADGANCTQDICQKIASSLILIKQLAYLRDLIVPLLFGLTQEADEETYLFHGGPPLCERGNAFDPEKRPSAP